MPTSLPRTGPAHAFMGLFHTNDFRSHSLLRDLEANFGEFQFFIIWDQYNMEAAVDFARYRQLRPIAKEQLFDFVSQRYGIAKDVLVDDCLAFPLLLRILLAIYLRQVVGIDYCIMTDNDIFLFEPIPEIVALSAAHVPFLIQETGAADILTDITDYITRHLPGEIRYVSPTKGRGYNAGFCGLDLAVFDAFDPPALRALLDTLRPMTEWWREQAFFVNMTFTSCIPLRATDTCSCLMTIPRTARRARSITAYSRQTSEGSICTICSGTVAPSVNGCGPPRYTRYW